MSPIYVHFCSCQNLSKFLKAWVWHSSNEDTCHCMWFFGFWNILKSTLIYQTIYIFDLRNIFFHHTAFTSTFAPVYTKETFRFVLKLELFSQLPLKEFSQEKSRNFKEFLQTFFAWSARKGMQEIAKIEFLLSFSCAKKLWLQRDTKPRKLCTVESV